MFDLKPLTEFFENIAMKFGAKMATVLTVDALILIYKVTDDPGDAIIIAKYVCITVITVVGLFLRSKQDNLKVT